jgi:hypothetical protein
MSAFSPKVYSKMWEYIKEDALCVCKVMPLQEYIQEEQKTRVLACRPIHEIV